MDTTASHPLTESATRAAEILIRDMTNAHHDLMVGKGDRTKVHLRYLEARGYILNCLRSTEVEADAVLFDWWKAYLALRDSDILVRAYAAFAYLPAYRRMKRKLARAITLCFV